MGQWKIDAESRKGILMLTLSGTLHVDELMEFVRAHNAAIDSFSEAPYRVFVDLRDMLPLSPDAAEVMAQAKLYSAARMNFQGSAVLVKSSTVAMQHRRTTQNVGLASTELISHDEDACWAHLRGVRRART